MAIEDLVTKADLQNFIEQVIRQQPAATVGAGFFTGTGSPENVVTAEIGAVYVRLDGGITTTLYVKEQNGGTNTGWTAK
jgi:hypothetical protein